MARNTWIGFISGAGLTALVAWSLGLGGKPTPPESSEPSARRVVTARVEMGAAALPVRFPTVTRARDRAHLSLTLAGRLVGRPVRVGENVVPGQVVARLDPQPFRHQLAAREGALAQVRAQWRQATRDAERSAALSAAGATGAEEREKTEAGAASLRAQLSQLEAQVEEARRQLREATLRAPFAAVVTDVHRHAGEFAAPGEPVVSLTGAATVEAELRLPETWRTHLVLGQVLEAWQVLPQPQTHRATVVSIGQAANGPAELFPVLLSLPAELPPGISLEVALPRPSHNGPTVPVAAVISPAGHDPFVFRVSGGRAERVPVLVRGLAGHRAEVVADLTPADRVIIAGQAALLEGDAVFERRQPEATTTAARSRP